MQIEDYMYQKDLYFSLGGKDQKLKEMSDGKWDILDQKALEGFRLSLALKVAFNIFREKTTKDLMATLSKMYNSASNKIFLMNKFNLKMEDSGSIDEHFNEFETLIS